MRNAHTAAHARRHNKCEASPESLWQALQFWPIGCRLRVYPYCLKKGGDPGKNEGRLQIPDQKRREVARQKRGEGGLLVFKRYRAFLAKIWVNIIPKWGLTTSSNRFENGILEKEDNFENVDRSRKVPRKRGEVKNRKRGDLLFKAIWVPKLVVKTRGPSPNEGGSQIADRKRGGFAEVENEDGGSPRFQKTSSVSGNIGQILAKSYP